jgi:hypothetical protein
MEAMRETRRERMGTVPEHEEKRGMPDALRPEGGREGG